LSRDILESEEFNPPVSTLVDSFDLPTIDESTIEGPTPRSVEQAEQSLNFQIMEGASERGKRKIIDSCGYSYNVKRQRLHDTDWQCTVRPTVSFFFFVIKIM